jgi:hypothetical protein
MREYAKTLENETNSKKENTESVLERLREFTSTTLRLQSDSLVSWERNLNKAIVASTNEHINFLRAV